MLSSVGIAAQYLAVALVLYLLAAHRGMLSIVVVLASLYPAIPVLLGIFYLRERVTAWQLFGLAGATAAIVLLTVS